MQRTTHVVKRVLFSALKERPRSWREQLDPLRQRIKSVLEQAKGRNKHGAHRRRLIALKVKWQGCCNSLPESQISLSGSQMLLRLQSSLCPGLRYLASSSRPSHNHSIIGRRMTREMKQIAASQDIWDRAQSHVLKR
jgi:hypothetical protein